MAPMAPTVLMVHPVPSRPMAMVLLAMDHPRMVFLTPLDLAWELQVPVDPAPKALLVQALMGGLTKDLTQDPCAKARLTEDRCRIRDLLSRGHQTEDRHARDRLTMVLLPRALPVKGLLTRDLLGMTPPMVLLIVELLLMDHHAGPFPMGLTSLVLTLGLMVLIPALMALPMALLGLYVPDFAVLLKDLLIKDLRVRDLNPKGLRLAALHPSLRLISRSLRLILTSHFLRLMPTSHFLRLILTSHSLRLTSRCLSSRVDLHLLLRPISHFFNNQA